MSTSIYSRRSSRGFTIVELLIVIVVIAILASISVVAYSGIQERAEQTKVRADVSSINKKIQLQAVEANIYPSAINDCPTPITGNMCIQQAGVDDIYYSKAPVSGVINPRNVSSYEVASLGKKEFFYSSPMEIMGGNEFLQYTDLAPFIDKYGLTQYKVEFDIKSVNTSSKNTINVYMQNGSEAKYGGLDVNIPVTTSFVRHSITFKPYKNSDNIQGSILAFYGTYHTGNIPVVKNVSFSKK